MALTNVGAGISTVNLTTAVTTTLARLIDTATNSLTVKLTGGQTVTALTASNEETINLASTNSTAVTLSTLTDTDLTTLNITGSGKVTISTLAANSTSAGSVLTIDGSTNTGGIVVSAVNSTLNAAMTGSATAANTITGGAGADTIVGGAAADSIVGGAGSDILTGGGGADTFDVLTSSNGAVPSATIFDTITDFAVASDILKGTNTWTVETSATASSGVAKIDAEGIATFNVADATLALRLAAVEAGIVAGTESAGDFAVFTYGSDSYVFIHDGTSGLASTDVLVKLTGVTGLTDTTISTTSLTIA